MKTPDRMARMSPMILQVHERHCLARGRVEADRSPSIKEEANLKEAGWLEPLIIETTGPFVSWPPSNGQQRTKDELVEAVAEDEAELEADAKEAAMEEDIVGVQTPFVGLA